MRLSEKIKAKGTVGLENYNYISRAELKSRAKDLLRGRWKDAILLNVVPTVLTIILMILAVVTITLVRQETGISTGGGIDSGNYGVSSSNDFDSTGSGIISTFITVGISYTFLNWLRDPGMQIRPLKDAFQAFTKKYFLSTLLIYIITFIFTVLWTLLLVIPGIIKSFSYSQAYFIYKDREAVAGSEKPSALDCITESRRMMDGHKWEYFILQLSFIGWGLLSILTLGIGFLWLNPYMNATYAAFYDNLSQNYYADDEIADF